MRESFVRKKKARNIPKPGKTKLRVTSLTESESGSEKENAGTGYEKCREQRIRENRERMVKLGIFSLSSQMFDSKKRSPKTLNPKKTRYPPMFPRPPRSYEPRRSSRLKNVTQANFLENERSLKDMGIEIPDSWKAEIYTEEDEKLLGDCEAPWTLNVEGFGEDGERLYDPVNGTSCHQCRQKTIQKHTYCSKCRSGQGQLCGDCLYTRYGENLSEAVKNLSWLCPGCRGICNCSRCRRAKGWPPVTILYSKVIESGFKSVAHYLILTRCGGNKPQEPEDGTMAVDLTEGETPMAPLDDDCSDTSAEWSGSDSDDSDIEVSKPKKENSDQAVEKQVDVITEVSSEPADKNEVLKEEMAVNDQVDGELNF